jgi:hypothetical protein
MFLKLDYPGFDPFEPVLKRLLDLAFATGENALVSAGFQVADIQHHNGPRRLFIRNVHYGYDQAQDRIGRLVIDLERRISATERELSQVPRSKDARGLVLERIRVMRDRQLVLRRIVDTILMTLVRFDTWILRRLSLDSQIRRIDPTVLGRMLHLAADRNAQSRFRFNLICDLTTFAQIGDLVEIDPTPGRPKSWRIVELKEGRVNSILAGALSDGPSEQPDQTLEEIQSSLGNKAVRQARRMLAQQTRMKNLDEIVRTDHGIDPATKQEIFIGPDEVITERYDGTLRRIVEAVRRQEIAATTVDGCLHLIGIQAGYLERHGGLGAVRHLFFHLVNPARTCGLGTPEMQSEIRALGSVPPFIDLVWHGFYAQWGIPPFLWMGEEAHSSLDLVMSRIRLFILFDFPAFFTIAAASGIKMSWITGKEAEEIKRRKSSQRIPGSPDAWGIRAQLADGRCVQLLSGFAARAVADLTRPRQLIEWAIEIARAPDPSGSSPL